MAGTPTSSPPCRSVVCPYAVVRCNAVLSIIVPSSPLAHHLACCVCACMKTAGAGREEGAAEPGAERGGRALPPRHLRRHALPQRHARHAAQQPRRLQPDPAQRPPRPPGLSVRPSPPCACIPHWLRRPSPHHYTPPPIHTAPPGVHLQRGAGQEDPHRPPLRHRLPLARLQGRRAHRVRHGGPRGPAAAGAGTGGGAAQHHGGRAPGVPGEGRGQARRQDRTGQDSTAQHSVEALLQQLGRSLARSHGPAI